jgi:hypothetical protein
VHNVDVLQPVQGVNQPHAKCLVAEQALSILSDDTSPSSLVKICSCPKATRRRKNKKRKKSKPTPPGQAMHAIEHTSLPTEMSRPASEAIEATLDSAPPAASESALEIPVALKDLDSMIDDETEEGFAKKGEHLLEVFDNPLADGDDDTHTASSEDEDDEVKKMLLD